MEIWKEYMKRRKKEGRKRDLRFGLQEGGQSCLPGTWKEALGAAGISESGSKSGMQIKSKYWEKRTKTDLVSKRACIKETTKLCDMSRFCIAVHGLFHK